MAYENPKEAKRDPGMYGLPPEAKRWKLKTIRKVLKETRTSDSRMRSKIAKDGIWRI